MGNVRKTVYLDQFPFWKDLLALPALFFQGQEGGTAPSGNILCARHFTCGSVLMSSLWVYCESSEWLITIPVVTQDRLESQGSDPSLGSYHCPS